MVGAALATSMWQGERAAGRIVPEGWDDLTLEYPDRSCYLQVKSRQPHRGPFRDADVVAFLVDGWNHHQDRLQHGDSKFVVVLEQPLGDLVTEGERNLANSAAASQLSTLLSARVGTERADEILRRSELWIWPDPRQDSVRRLVEGLNLPEAACLGHVNALRTAIGEAADDNVSASEEDRHGLSVTDVTVIIERASSLVDTNGLLEAVNRGICESVDLMTPISDENFYLGIDVVPGHVAAGLTVPRDEVLSAVDDALHDRRVVLVAGPSGSGKSALLWSVAYENRGCRWYRIRRLTTTEDVTLIVRLARAHLPSERTPVGFVVDNVGQAGAEAWDELVRELSTLPGTYLLGAAREEDLFVVSTLPRLNVIRIGMDEALAESMFEHLKSQGRTHWAHWREPYETSQGLLLEYMHLLSAGVRLREVIEEQIRNRRREGRDLELRILSIAGTAAAWGAVVPLDRMIAALGETHAAISGALERLDREHLIKQHGDRMLAGLHQVRSRAIFSAIHDHPPPLRADSIAATIGMLEPPHLQSFLVGLLSDSPDLVDDVITASSARLAEVSDPRVAIATLQALRIVEFRYVVSQWLDILDEEGVPRAMRALTATFAIADIDTGPMGATLDPRVAAATNRLRTGNDGSPALRDRLLQRLPREWAVQLLFSCGDCQVAARLLATLDGLGDAHPSLRTLPGVENSQLATAVAPANLHDLASLIASARTVSIETADRMTELVGGPDQILGRAEQSTPWARKLEVGPASDELLDGRDIDGLGPGALVSRVEYRFISDLVQDDVHAETVELARTIISCHPALELVHAVATDARERPHGFGGLEIANKWLQRSRLVTDNQIAWNRARIRTIESAISAQSHTDRIAIEPELIGRVATLLNRLGTIWITGRGGSRTILAELDTERAALLAAIDDLPPPPVDPETSIGPLDTGGESTRDLVQSLLRRCVVNAYSGIIGGSDKLRSVAAMLAEAAANEITPLVEPDRWKLLGLSRPPEEVDQLAETLGHLACVTAELAYGHTSFTQLQTSARSAHRTLAVHTAARVAREAADQRFEQACGKLKHDIETKGSRPQVHTRPTSRPGAVWPPTDVLVMVQVDRLDRWTALLEHLPNARTALMPTHSVWAIPVRDDVAVPSFAVSVLPDKVIPAFDAWADWQLSETALDDDGANGVFRRVLDIAVALSAIAVIPGGERPGHEEETAEHLAQDLNKALNAFLDIVRRHASCPLLIEAGHVVEKLAVQIRDEFQDSAASGELARSMLDLVDGNLSTLANTLVGCGYLLAEFDIDPDAARRWHAELSGDS